MVLSKNKILLTFWLCTGTILFYPIRSMACDCDIEAPFLDVARDRICRFNSPWHSASLS